MRTDQARHGPRNGHAARGGMRRAFTLVELLVVIGIIGILSAAALPSIRSLTQSNTLASGSRQILDDLAYARQLAISGRRTVYMVFVPPQVVQHVPTIQAMPQALLSTRDRAIQITLLTNVLRQSQYLGYALFAKRAVGDQPGQGSARYLTGWKELPEGMLFATNKFLDLGNAQWVDWANEIPATNRPLPHASFPFPADNSPERRLPYIAFDWRGQLYYEGFDGTTPPTFDGESLGLTRGSVFFPFDQTGTYPANQDYRRYLVSPPDVVENPKDNRLDVRIDWLTGRAKVEKPALP